MGRRLGGPASSPWMAFSTYVGQQPGTSTTTAEKGGRFARCCGPFHTACLRLVYGAFFFFILKKSKFQKYISILKNFKNIPRSSYLGRHALNVIFFLQICNEVPGWGRARARGTCRPPSGDRWASSTSAIGGSVSPPSGDRVLPLYISILPPFPPYLSPKIPPKIQKKREG